MTGVTRYLATRHNFADVGEWEFGLSSPDVTSGATTQCKTTNIILCQI